MLPLDLLGVALTRGVRISVELTGLGTPTICVIAGDAKRLQQRLQLHKYSSLRRPKTYTKTFPLQ
jgi:hypothetical protein